MRGRKIVSVHTYRRAFDVFVEQGDHLNFSAAKRALGLGTRAIQKIYWVGLKESIRYKTPKLPPLRDVLDGSVTLPGFELKPKPNKGEEGGEATPAPQADPPPASPAPLQVVATPVAPTLRETEMAEHALQTVRSEWQALGFVREAATGTAAVSLRILAALQTKAERLRGQIELEAKSDVPVDATAMIKQMGQLASIVREASETMKDVITNERLIAGSPTQILGIVQPQPAAAKPSQGDAGDVLALISRLGALGNSPEADQDEAGLQASEQNTEDVTGEKEE